MFKNMKIANKLTILIFLIITGISIVGGVGYLQSRSAGSHAYHDGRSRS